MPLFAPQEIEHLSTGLAYACARYPLNCQPVQGLGFLSIALHCIEQWRLIVQGRPCRQFYRQKFFTGVVQFYPATPIAELISTASSPAPLQTHR